jgi:serine/threonine-protein phosphatase 4 regulatory subunit 2
MHPTPSATPTTPLFSPIPFLHDDARRSKSCSPPPSPLALIGSGRVVPGDLLEQKALGLVDELDDPSPGHMSEHPTALSSVTTMTTPRSRPFLGSLEQRFTKGEDETAAAQGEPMVVDEAEDKENNG